MSHLGLLPLFLRFSLPYMVSYCWKGLREWRIPLQHLTEAQQSHDLAPLSDFYSVSARASARRSHRNANQGSALKERLSNCWRRWRARLGSYMQEQCTIRLQNPPAGHPLHHCLAPDTTGGSPGCHHSHWLMSHPPHLHPHPPTPSFCLFCYSCLLISLTLDSKSGWVEPVMCPCLSCKGGGLKSKCLAILAFRVKSISTTH